MIEIKTRYTFEIYKEYYWFSMFRGKYYRYGKATFPFLAALMIIVFLYSVFLGFDSLFPAVASAIGTVIFVLFYVIALIVPKYYFKRAPSLFQTDIEFVFDEDGISSVQTGDIASGTGVTKYGALVKAYETRTTFYLYMSPRQALLLSKKDFVKGTPEDLRGLLQSKMPPKKFVLCK